jgi:hypothetical protein
MALEPVRVFALLITFLPQQNNGFGSQRNNLATPREVATHEADLRPKQADKTKKQSGSSSSRDAHSLPHSLPHQEAHPYPGLPHSLHAPPPVPTKEPTKQPTNQAATSFYN